MVVANAGPQALEKGTSFVYDIVGIMLSNDPTLTPNGTTEVTLATDPNSGIDADIIFTGTDLTTNGTVTDISLNIDDENVLSISGLSLSSATILDALQETDAAVKTQKLVDLFNGTDWEFDLSESTATSLVFGTGGNDTFTLGSGDDLLMADGGTDNSNTGGGADFIYAKNLLGYSASGLSTIDGGTGNDTFALDMREFENQEPPIVDFFKKGQTFDLTKVFVVGDVSIKLTNVENARGTQYADKLLGSQGMNELSGVEGNDTLTGRGGEDKLLGGDGNDVLIGGAAADRLMGGKGNDHFVFATIADSAKQHDIITDFKHKQDELDLSKLHPDTKNDKFVFIGEQKFGHHAGELQVIEHDNSGTKNDFTMVQADLDGNGRADIQIELTHLLHLDRNDFIL